MRSQLTRTVQFLVYYTVNVYFYIKHLINPNAKEKQEKLLFEKCFAGKSELINIVTHHIL